MHNQMEFALSGNVNIAQQLGLLFINTMKKSHKIAIQKLQTVSFVVFSNRLFAATMKATYLKILEFLWA